MLLLPNNSETGFKDRSNHHVVYADGVMHDSINMVTKSSGVEVLDI